QRSRLVLGPIHDRAGRHHRLLDDRDEPHVGKQRAAPKEAANMSTLIEQFRAKTRRWYEAPSGIEYEICALSQVPGSAGLDAIFELYAQQKELEAKAAKLAAGEPVAADAAPAEEKQATSEE